MQTVFKTIRILFFVLFILWTVQSSFHFIQTAQHLWNPNTLNQDAASGWEHRLQGMKDDLPEQSVVGFVSEQDYPGTIYSATDQDEEFALSQYALAPLILDRGNTHRELVIGNFAGDFEYDFESVLGLSLIHNYGYGIYLFRGVEE